MPDAPRAPRFAGRLYPADGGRLRAAVESYIEDAAATRAEGALVGLLVPHQALATAGVVAGYAYKMLLTTPLTWDCATVLAPSASLAEDAIACDPAATYDLPTDPVHVDQALAAALRADGVPITEAEDDEPVIEMHLPFVQAALGDVAVLPLRVGLRARSDALDRAAGRLGLVVAAANLPEGFEQAACDAIARLDAGFFAGALESPRRGLAGLFGARPARPPASPDGAVLGLALSLARAQGATDGLVIRRNGQLAACALLRR